MSENDVLVGLLGSVESTTSRRPENIRERGNGDSKNASEYDLTNPNLHHGAEDPYRPVQASELLGSSPSIVPTGASSAIAVESFVVGNQHNGVAAGVVADQSGDENQGHLLDASIQSQAPLAIDTPVFSASSPAGLNIDFPTGAISDTPTEGNAAGSPITATATGFQHTTIDDTVVIDVDGTQTATKAAAVTVDNANDHAPMMTSNGGGASASLNIAENTSAVTTLTADDADPGSTLTYSIVGGADAAKFTVDASTGALSFVSAPDYEHPTDIDANNIYDVTVQVSDGTKTATQAVVVTVDNVNDNAPVITSNGAGASASLNIAENTTAVTTITANDADAGATLTYSIVGGADAAKFTVDASTGALSFVSAPDYEHPTDTGANNIYDVTVQVSDGTQTATQTLAVTVDNVNDNAPVITSNGAGASALLNIAENTTAVTTITANDADAGATLTYSIVGGADAAKFTVDASTGALSFVSAPDYEHPTDTGANNIYDVTVQVSDGTQTATQTLAMTVDNVNDNAPVITSNGAGASASLNIAENTTAVATVAATDADAGSTLTYSIVGGADAAKFTVDASTGALSFVSAPDYEHPTDTGANNIYDVAVQVSDGTQTATQTLAVMVDNVNDNTPVISSNGAGATASVNIAENTAAVTTITATDADAGATLTYSIVGGADAAKFTVDASTGALSFVAAPDYEHPTDAGANNVYDVTVQVSDGTKTDTQAMAITVDNVNEAPTGLQSQVATIQEDVASGGTIGTAFSSAGRLVATLVGTDPDSVHGDALGYSIVGGDSAKYEILNGNEIHVRSGVILDYETDATDSVTIRIVDSHGATFDQQFNIDVTNYAGSFSGTTAAETISGTSEEDVINAGGGNDVIAGRAGNDFINGDAGNDTAIYSGASTDYTFTLNSNGSIAIADGRGGSPDGTDTLTSVEALQFSDKQVSIIAGTSGNDAIYGTDANDLILAGSGNDLVYGSYGTDTLDGGSGTDTINYSQLNYNMTIDLSQGLGYVTGYVAGADHLYNFENAVGGNLNDTLIGNASANVLAGGAGTDTLIGGAGADSLDGGTGIDTADYSGSSAGVTVNLATAGAQSGGDATGDILSNIENIVGSAFNDTLIGDAGANVISGGIGDDVLIGGTGNMLINGSFEADQIAAGSWAPSATLTGWTAASGDFETWNHLTTGSHTYTASDGAQSIELDSGTGLDSFYQDVQTVSGEQYTLSLDAAMRADGASSTGTIQVFWNGGLIDSFDPTSTSWTTHSYTVTGDGGLDRLSFSEVAADNDSFGGLIDNVRLVGNDTLDGGAGNDTLIGGAGNDRLVGGLGIDTADYSTATGSVIVNLSLGAAQDTVHAGTDTLSGIENLTGSHYNDTLTGDSNDNVITGGLGNDNLSGGSGSDTFIYHVGDGDDIVAGGTGASWTDTVNLHDGASSLGTYGVDWTMTVTSGSIVSADTTHHTITLSQDAGGHIDLSNGATINFTELERITW